jgi:hypothetical protein
MSGNFGTPLAPPKRLVPRRWISLQELRRRTIARYLRTCSEPSGAAEKLLLKISKDIKDGTPTYLRVLFFQTVMMGTALVIVSTPGIRLQFSMFSVGDNLVFRDILIFLYSIIMFYNATMQMKMQNLRIVREEAIKILSCNKADRHVISWLHTDPMVMEDAFLLEEEAEVDIGPSLGMKLVGVLLIGLAIGSGAIIVITSVLIPFYVIFMSLSDPSSGIFSYGVCAFLVANIIFGFIVALFFKIPLPHRDYSYVFYLQELQLLDPIRHAAEIRRFVATRPAIWRRWTALRRRLSRRRKVST